MIFKLKIILILILLMKLSFTNKAFSKSEIFIIYNINNNIITNIDVKKEARYLIALNDQLKNLPEKEIFKISKESILRENIKKIELSRYFNLDTADENPMLNSYIERFYTKLKLKDLTKFEEFLKTNDLSINYVKKKIYIEITWNKLIYDKYKNQVKINKKKIKNQIELSKNVKNEKLYFLSEIVFEKDNQNSFNEKVKKINDSIKEIGFKNSANIYSISNSAKFGGEVGWIKEKQLSNKIIKELINLSTGQHSNPILTGNSFIILKINDIKIEEKKIDVDKQVEKKIQYELNRQLEQFSKIYYNKVKINTNINEL
jgi:peptidyl-prolyl cis-trans isomerase SurA